MLWSSFADSERRSRRRLAMTYRVRDDQHVRGLRTAGEARLVAVSEIDAVAAVDVVRHVGVEVVSNVALVTGGIVECGIELLKVFFRFFFFQAEDGIRDLIVTGVQTCALPI